MIGPQLRFSIRSTQLTIGAVDLAILLVFSWLAIESVTAGPLAAGLHSVLAIAITGLFLCFGWLLEHAKLAYSRSGDRVGPVMLSTFGAVMLTRAETIDDNRARQVGRNGFMFSAVTAVIFLVPALSVRGESGWLPGAVFVVATLTIGMALIRTCPIQGLDGGQVSRWYLATICDDDEGVAQVAGLVSFGSSLLFMFSGFLVLAQPGHWNVWGLAMMAAGLDCAVLTQWHARRSRWIRAASTKRVDEIGQSRLPTIKHSAPISELLSIFAVEGQRAMVVVTDDRGQPTGLIQLRQLKAAVHAGAAAHPDDMMITLSTVPHFARETSILDAALYLERTGQLALVMEVTAGKLRVVSLDELQRIAD